MKASVVALIAIILLAAGFLIWKNTASPSSSTADTASSDLNFINFSSDPATPGYEVARDYFAQDIADAKKFKGVIPPYVDVAEVDLNNDGQKEVIVFLRGSGICGASNCPLAILMKKDGKWKDILGNVSAQFVSLAPTYTNGMMDLILGDGGKVWKWNGEMYE